MHDAFIFPGQGSQYPGMGADLFASSSFAQDFYKSANEILGFNLSEVSFHGPLETLSQTEYTQPSIFVHSVILDQFLKEKQLLPYAVAGHSLGEFSALVSADILSFEDALNIVKVRSSEMARIGRENEGTMAAIIGADSYQLKKICNQDGIVVPANINAPGQVVISGERKAVDAAITTAKKIGVRRALPINVSGAFHSPLMAPVRVSLQESIDSMTFHNAKIPIFQNIHGKPVTNATEIKLNLLNQLENPVLWSPTILNMKKMGISNFIEVGPGKVLKGLNQRIFPECTTTQCDKFEHLDNLAVL